MAAVVGLVLGRARLVGWWASKRAALAPFIAARLPWAAVGLPVVLTGNAGFTGFAKITDLAHQISFMERLRTEGRTQIGVANYS